MRRAARRVQRGEGRRSRRAARGPGRRLLCRQAGGRGSLLVHCAASSWPVATDAGLCARTGSALGEGGGSRRLARRRSRAARRFARPAARATHRPVRTRLDVRHDAPAQAAHRTTGQLAGALIRVVRHGPGPGGGAWPRRCLARRRPASAHSRHSASAPGLSSALVLRRIPPGCDLPGSPGSPFNKTDSERNHWQHDDDRVGDDPRPGIWALARTL